MKTVIASILVSVGLAGGLQAGESEPPHITVNGTAITEVTPDELVWRLEVHNTNASPEEVAAEHTNTVQTVLRLLREAKVEVPSIQTSWMQFGENWEYEHESRVKRGYYASTYIGFKVTELEKYSALWLGLSKIRCVSVDYVAFDVTRRTAIQKETREKALIAAKEKAATMAKTLGEGIGEPLCIEEDVGEREDRIVQTNIILSGPDERTAGGGALAPGKIPIKVRVKVSFRLVGSHA